MRKEINSKSKRKWVAGGLAAFASVALLTTGFATWVVINGNKAADNDIGVTVDTAENNSVRLEMELSGGISLEEEKGTLKAGKVLSLKTDPTKEKPLSVNINKLIITFGKGVDVKEYTKLHFEITMPEKNQEDYVLPNAEESDNLMGTDRTGDSWTYINAPADIAVDLNGEYTKKTTSGSTYTWTYPTEKTLDFTWGSFFGGDNKSPKKYYNGEPFASKSDAEIVTVGDKAVMELNAMREKFIKTKTGEGEQQQITWKKINLKATLTK